jgi:hypothetical protein
VRVEAALLRDTKKPINLNVFAGKEIPVVMDRIERRTSKDYSWFGKIAGKAPGTATFVVRNGNVTGIIRSGNEIYSVEPLGDGLHVIMRIDPGKFPPDHPKDFDSKTRIEPSADTEKPLLEPIRLSWWQRFRCWFSPKFCITTIDVVVAYTESAESQVSDMDSLIQLAVDEANLSYRKSGINLRLRLVYKYQINYTESGSFGTDLARFRNSGDGYMESIHNARDKYKADVAVLIINNTQYCGLASTIMAQADTAFAVVYWDCATGYFSFAHEIGHLQGARHNCGVDSSVTPYQYGHGFINTGGGWRTIMAYNDSSCSGGSCTRIQYWSSTVANYGGAPMSTACSSATNCCANNARVLNLTRNTVAGFR